MDPAEPRAIIDIGSHSVLLLAAGGPAEAPEVLLEEYRITALGSGMTSGNLIAAEAAGRTRRVLDEYLNLCRGLGISTIRMVATDALREAENRSETLAALSGPGTPPLEILSPDREAALTRSGALSGLNLPEARERAVVADLGGRSTEITWPGFSRSLPVGCQRESDSFLPSDPPTETEIARLDEHLRAELAGLPPPPAGGRLVVSGGTSTTLASMDLALISFRTEAVHGHPLPCRRLAEQSRMLLSLPLGQRRKLTGLEPDRAPVIPAGAVILLRICEWHPSREVLVSARGLTWGVWLALET